MAGPDAPKTPKAPRLKRRRRRRPVQYFVLVFNLAIALLCFITAAVLIAGQQVLNGIHKTAELAAAPITEPPRPTDPVDSNPTDGTGNSAPIETATTVADFPDADPTAKNFLITGSDNGACDDQTAEVGERGGLGERSDTIMIMRVDPSTSRAAILSFPRDLWVKIHGTNGNNRINSAYRVNDPNKLILTIADNFGIAVDHYIQIDFCAFKTLVDAVGGVSVPFEFAARDTHLPFNVEPGCVKFDGATALAYVRSRHYEWRDENGKYHQDGSSDYGRIARQQDFLRRAVAKVLSQGFSPSIAKSLITVAQDYVVTDPDLTLEDELQFAGVLKHLNPAEIHTYQVEGTGKRIGGNDVIEPRLKGANMQAILAIFQGRAQLESAPDQVFESTTTTVPRTTTTATTTPRTTTTRPSSTASTTRPPTTTTTTTTTTTPATTTTLPEVTVDQNINAIVPPLDVTCN